MRKLPYILLAIIMLFNIPILATADTVQWVRITEDNTPLYANANTSKTICILAKSYYLEVLEVEGTYYHVELLDNHDGYTKILGYVACSTVEICQEHPTTPYYPKVQVTVSSSSTPLHMLPLDSSAVLVTATNTQLLHYYGYIESDGQQWYYVYFYQMLGYVSAQDVTIPNIPMHPTPLVVDPPTPPPIPPIEEPTEEPTAPTNPATSEILLIVFVSVLSIALVLALFLPKKAPPSTTNIWDNQL